jgi:hypothetical protein
MTKQEVRDLNAAISTADAEKLKEFYKKNHPKGAEAGLMNAESILRSGNQIIKIGNLSEEKIEAYQAMTDMGKKVPLMIKEIRRQKKDLAKGQTELTHSCTMIYTNGKPTWWDKVLGNNTRLSIALPDSVAEKKKVLPVAFRPVGTQYPIAIGGEICDFAYFEAPIDNLQHSGDVMSVLEFEEQKEFAKVAKLEQLRAKKQRMIDNKDLTILEDLFKDIDEGGVYGVDAGAKDEIAAEMGLVRLSPEQVAKQKAGAANAFNMGEPDPVNEPETAETAGTDTGGN